jgi:hypothetical protein
MNYYPNPGNAKAVKAWNRKLQFVHTMLTERVLIHTSRRIVQRYEGTLDGRQALYDLALQAQHSTEAVLAGRRTREKIAQTRYDPRSGSALSFITKFEELMEAYNRQQRNPGMVLTGPMMKSFLQTSVAGVMMLRSVSERESDRTIRGGPEFSYEEYLEAIKNAATIYDENIGGRRSINVVQTTDDNQAVDEITEYFVNMIKKRSPGASMNKETWQSISEDGKAVWDKMSNGDKQKILQYAMKRASAKEAMSVNQTSTQEPEESNEANELGTDVINQDQQEPSVTETEVHQVISKAKSEAHPGDVRRVLSGTPKKKAMTQVKFAQWYDDGDWHDAQEEEDGISGLLEEYGWDSDNNQDF